MKKGFLKFMTFALVAGISSVAFADSATRTGSGSIALAYRILDIVSDQQGYGYDSKMDSCLETALAQEINLCASGAATSLVISNVHCSYEHTFVGGYRCAVSSANDPNTFVVAKGARAEALFSAMVTAGFASEGAAGSVHIGGSNLVFNFDYTQFNGGGGANLNYETDFVTN